MTPDIDISQTPAAGPPAATDLLLAFPPAPSNADPVTRTVEDVFQGMLAPLEEDFFGSFQAASAFLDAQTQDRRGSWSLTTDASGAPDAANELNLPAVADGDYTLCVAAKMRSDPDNNVLAYTPAMQVAAFASGQVIYVHAPGNAKNYLKMTLTSAGTAVGQGNAAYIYAAVTIDEVGDVADTDDWNRFSTKVPPDVSIDSSLITGLAALWDRMLVVLEGAAAILKRARQIIQGNNEQQTLSVTRVQGTPAAAGQIGLDGLGSGIGQLLFWPPATLKDGTAFEVEDLKEFKSGDFLSYGALEWEIGDTPWIKFGFGDTKVLTASVMLADGYAYDAADVPALNATADFVLEGRDIHLGLVVAAILKRAVPNIGGNGGAAGNIWAYLTSATNATWRRLLDVLKEDANTAAKKGDYRAALSTGRLQKDIAGSGAVVLTDAEAAYDSIEFTGAMTGDRICTLPAAPTGLRMLRHQATGAHTLKVKAAGQADAAAVALTVGDNAIFHHGGSLARLGEKRRFTNSIGSTQENIATGLHDDDEVTVAARTTESSGDRISRGFTRRFADIDDTRERIMFGITGYNEALLVVRSGTDLKASKGGGLDNDVEVVVYVERKTYVSTAL